MADRTHSHLALLALVAAVGAGGVLVIGAGCTVLKNDALPDDAGVFEAGEAGDGGKATACASCLATACTAQHSLCLTNESCVGVVECAAPATCDSTCKTTCGCNAIAAPDAGLSAERLHHAFTACNDARLGGCSTDCAAESRGVTTLPSCSVPDAGPVDAAVTDAAIPDAQVIADAGAPVVPGPDACQACASTRCAPALAACGVGSECAAFLSCSSVCLTGSCVEDCARLHATGKVTATELATCTASSCQNDCEL